MSRKTGTIRTVAASLVLAGAAIFSSAASAQKWPTISPECRQEAVAECTTMWQAYGYRSYDDCAEYQPCYHCLAGYMCPFYDFTYAARVDTGKPW